MDKEKRLQAFKQYIEICEKKKEYVGLGNPCADILLIGKEPSIKGNDEEHILRNIRDVKACFENNDLSCLYKQDKPAIANHTWNLYQKLIGYVYNYKCEDNKKTDFGTFAFTTEMNNTVSLRTATADRKYRLDTFKKSSFIQDFPVVVLACSNYIHNIEGDWQINETFNVTFDVEDGAHINYSPGNWFYTHHSRPDKKRLVIHTRQLSQNCNDELLRDIAESIKSHLDFLNKITK